MGKLDASETLLSQTSVVRVAAIAVPKAKEPFLKRPLDIALSAGMLLLLAPLSLIIALAIKLEDGGPIFYRQERWGQGGTRFRVFKFRTMVPDSDQKFGLKQAEENDPRITRVGRILRASGLDELPQILNILRGEMSFVGPRALAVGELVDDGKGNYINYEEIPGLTERLSVRPGLTSLATIYIPKDTVALRKFRYDHLYIRKRSLWLDLRLIALSFWISLQGKWEIRGRKVWMFDVLKKPVPRSPGAETFITVAIVYVSLLAALVLRFLRLVFVDQINSPTVYWDFVHYSMFAFRNSILPVLAFGLVVFYVSRRESKSTTAVAEFMRGFCALTGLFIAMVILGVVVGPNFTFPRVTWIGAWVLAFLGFSAITITRCLDSKVKERIVYNRASQMFIDCLIAGAAFSATYVADVDSLLRSPSRVQILILAPYIMLLYIGVSYFFGVYTFVWRFTGLRETLVIGQSVGATALVLLVLRILFFESYDYLRVPFGALVLQPVLTFLGVVGVRMARRIQYQRNVRRELERRREPGRKIRLLIAGVGKAALILIRELERMSHFELVGFVDSDKQKTGQLIHGVPVLGTTQMLTSVARAYNIEVVVLGVLDAPGSFIRQLVNHCDEISISVLTIPALSKIALQE
ncbi:MAG: sugar transferase [Acidobacteria bacterium]|nr:sugar transferase [Acidobacteriota bacterium]